MPQIVDILDLAGVGDSVDLVEEDGDRVRKGSIPHLKGREEDKDDQEEIELKVMALEKRVKKEKVVKGKEEEGSIDGSSDDEDLEQDQALKAVAVREVRMVKQVEMMVSRTVEKEKIDRDDQTDHLDHVVKEGVVVVHVKAASEMVSNVLEEEVAEEVVDVVAEIVDLVVEAVKKVVEAKEKLSRY